MNRLFKTAATLALGATLLLPAPHASAADTDLRPITRELAEKLKGAVLRVRIIMSVGRGGSTADYKGEGNATIINPDGLAVVSLTNIDPFTMGRSMRGDDDEGGGPESRIRDIKFIMPDKKEVPATVVLRDRDLNIAFLRPIKPLDKPMPFVDLKNSGDAGLLDKYIMLARLGPIADRQLSAQEGVIEAIVSKPRKFYVPGGVGPNGYGIPAFNAEGKVLGLFVWRTQAGGEELRFGEGIEGLIPIILPASDVAEIAAQAPMEGEKLAPAPTKDDKKTPAKGNGKPEDKTESKSEPKTPAKSPADE